MKSLDEFERFGTDVIVMHKVKEAWTPEMVQVIRNQERDGLVRGLVHRLKPGFEVVQETPRGHVDGQCTIEEPHDHDGYAFRIVPSDWEGFRHDNQDSTQEERERHEAG